MIYFDQQLKDTGVDLRLTAPNLFTRLHTNILATICHEGRKNISKELTRKVAIALTVHIISEFIFTLPTSLTAIIVTYVVTIARVCKAANIISSVTQKVGKEFWTASIHIT